MTTKWFIHAYFRHRSQRMAAMDKVFILLYCFSTISLVCEVGPKGAQLSQHIYILINQFTLSVCTNDYDDWRLRSAKYESIFAVTFKLQVGVFTLTANFLNPQKVIVNTVCNVAPEGSNL